MNDTLTKYEQSQMTTESVHTEMVQNKNETISSVLAAQAKAEVEARFIVAMNNPRNPDVVRLKMLKEVERPGFADVAWYDLEKQYKGSGFSIRFAEAAMRSMQNIDPRSTIIFDDDEKMIIKVEVVDLESNVSISNMILIRKEIERQKLKHGEEALSQRLNSYGKPVYRRRATSEEMLPLVNSAVSKAFRTAILRLLPGDVQDECKRRILEIRENNDAKDPDAVRRQVCDAFSQIGIGPEVLAEYLGHAIASASPSEMEALREIYRNVKAGELNFYEELESVVSDREEKKSRKSTIEKVTEKVKGNENDRKK